MRNSLLIILLIFGLLGASAQSVDELQRDMKQYEAEIKQLNILIQSNNKQQESYSQNLRLINQKITNRRKIIANLDQQIAIVEKRLGEEGTRIVGLSSDLTVLQKDYTALVKLAYINYKNNSLLTLISSDNYFLQSVRNVTNIERVSQSMRSKATHIDTLQTNIKVQMVKLTGEQERIAKLVKSKGAEVVQLDKEKKQVSVLAEQLKGKSTELKQKEGGYRKKLQGLQTQIAALIAKDSEKERSTGKKIDFALSGEFEQNQGKFPTPVSGGVVVDRFGVHNHPTEAGIKVSNNGINLACSTGSAVNVIFEGEVKNIFMVPSMGNSIIVRHGTFLTVYSNLESVSVKVGDRVKTGQKIGTVDRGQNILHFELWRETSMLNPEQWLNM